MQAHEALAFLRTRQPMPDRPSEADWHLYRATTDHFYDHPDEACIPLYLNSFGDWEDLTVYESVQAVIRRFPAETVWPHLEAALCSEHPAVRLWAADTARLIPHPRLIPFLRPLLKEEGSQMRLVAATALEAVGPLFVRSIASDALEDEHDAMVRDVLSDIVHEDAG
ncbi:HEAT repeat domain-containing protein [Sulfidibacter corallicola]|uniref:HEAT repeat domain-containing protein n=1 Tax=Sulfidibacter corallicola TaxID=2818388 RepID=A0A8A4TPW1_SULCO|nr:HEAT repeat domain-containing protein [Sulfidibacter corallicola]QTD51018.1 HEAT repeat domain-containing protein [Sulfidibacter corallicola]